VRETLQNTYSTDYLRKQSAGLFRSHAPQDDVDCEALVGKFFRLDGEEWEVIEADASSGLVKYARLCEGDTEQEISLEELEEVTLNEASALRARESVEATALEVDALVTKCRCAVAKARHERATKEGAEAAKRRQEQLEK
jgi:hypothetical protein